MLALCPWEVFKIKLIPDALIPEKENFKAFRVKEGKI
jgi:hypothetical protein